MYEVFDCTVSQGRLIRVPGRWTAKLLARLLSALTGVTWDWCYPNRPGWVALVKRRTGRN